MLVSYAMLDRQASLKTQHVEQLLFHFIGWHLIEIIFVGRRLAKFVNQH